MNMVSTPISNPFVGKLNEGNRNEKLYRYTGYVDSSEIAIVTFDTVLIPIVMIIVIFVNRKNAGFNNTVHLARGVCHHIIS